MIEITGLAANTWHDLYAAASITVGTEIAVYNKGITSCQLWEGASAPISTVAGVFLGMSDPIIATSGNPGIWIRCMHEVSVNIQELS